MRKIGQYEVIGELGRGAMGVVYKARHVKINMLVALKTITTSVADNPDLLERFYKEGRSLGVLQHPNIATIYDMGEDESLPFIAMEYVDGQSLGEVIAHRLAIPLYQKMDYAVQACRAFDYAHKRGIVHRDIKPGNVMLSKLGTVKVVDFGIARVLETSHTKSGIIMGTFAYMSPEIYNGEHADARSDIFSFGILLYELICYSKPFPGDSPATFMQSICLQEPKPLLEVAPDCPPLLAAVIEKMLLKPVSERYQTMEDLLLDLEPICRSLQVETVVELIAQSRELIQREEFLQARDLLRQVQKLDFGNVQARALLVKVDAILKKQQVRPKVKQLVENGIEALGGGKLDEALTFANNALELDSTFEPAQELQRSAQQEASRARLVKEKLQSARQRLAEGLLDDVEKLIAPILEQEPANSQALGLQEQVLEERARRQKLRRLLENMQRARNLWTHQNYDECIDLLIELQKEFPEEEDIRKLMETAREDRAEQHRQLTLQEARNLLAAGRYEACEGVLFGLQKEFPNDEEIMKLLEAAREDQAQQRKAQRLGEARNLLASKRHEDSIALLSELGQEFPNDEEIGKLVKIIREDQKKERIQQGIGEARTLLAARRYEECNALLAGLQMEFPGDDDILKLLAVVREGQAQERKLDRLAEARNLLASKRHEESIALLAELGKEFPHDEEIGKLVKIIREDQKKERRLQGLAEARNLLAAQCYEDCNAQLAGLQKEFPNDDEILRLLAAVREGQAQERKLERLTEARNMLASKRHEESIALLAELGKEFPNDEEIGKLDKIIHEDQKKERRQQGIVEARGLLASQRYEDCNALLAGLQKSFPNDDEILKLLAAAREGQGQQRKLERLAEARNLLASKRHEQSIALLAELGKEFPNDEEIGKLDGIVREDQKKERRKQGVAEARNLFAARRYEDCNAQLAGLQKEFPNDDEILKLLAAVREDQAQQRKLKTLAEARNLRGSKRYEDALSLLSGLEKDFPGDDDILKLRELVQDEWAEQRMLKGLADARGLLSSKRYEESVALLSDLQREFPSAKEIFKLRELVQDEWAEQRMLKGLGDARGLLSSKQYEKSIALLSDLQKEFPSAKEIFKLRELVQDEWAEQRMLKGLGDSRGLLSSKRYAEAIALLSGLQREFPVAKEIPKLLATAEREKAEQERQQKMLEARTLLAANRWEEALALLDSLLAVQPKDPAVLKLKALLLAEQEKHAKAERLQKEWEILKELTGKEAYLEAISRAEQLLRDYPGDGDLLRLLEFAREQQAQRDRALQLRKTLDQVEGLLKANRLQESIVAASKGLEAFPQNPDLSRLLEQAETRQKSEQRRRAIEQTVRNIKIQINREEFSDAIRTAEDTLETWGPDTDVTQLLSSARVEYTAREKKREEDRKLTDVRALFELGNLEEATLLLDETIKSRDLDPNDPRVQRLSEDIKAAISATESRLDTVVPAPPQESPAREYALFEGPPALPPTSLPESSTQPTTVPNASASQELVSPQPVVPPPLPEIAPISVSPAMPRSEPATPLTPEVEPEIGPTIQKPPIRTVKVKKQPSPSNEPSASPSLDVPIAPVGVKERPATIPIWRRPAAIGVALLGLILVIWRSIPQRPSPSHGVADNSNTVTSPPVTKGTGPELPNATRPEPPPSETSGKSDSTALWNQEDQLLSQAKEETGKAQFPQALKDLNKILTLPAGGRRKEEARNYINQVIPQRQNEEHLFADAEQSLRQNNQSGLQRAVNEFGQVAMSGGPRQQAAQKLQNDAKASLEKLNATLSSLIASARANLNRGDFSSARKMAGQIQQVGGDATSLNTEINQAEQSRFAQLESKLNQLKLQHDEGTLQQLKSLETDFRTLMQSGGPMANDARRNADSANVAFVNLTASLEASANAEKAIQGVLARARAATDLNALRTSRDDLQTIVRSGGPQATEAQQLLAVINQKISALAQPPPPPDEKPAIRAAMQQYAAAYEKVDAEALRKIWPFIDIKEYEGIKNSFSKADAIRMTWPNLSIEVAADNTTATITTDITETYTPKGSKTVMRIKHPDHSILHLVKQNGVWLIKDVH